MAEIKNLMKEKSSNELAKKFAKDKATKVVGNGAGKATMKDRILPIRDFKKVIEHDKVYLGVLQSLQANLSLHEVNLARKLTPIMNDNDKRMKRAKEFIDWDETKIKMYDVRGQIEAHNKLITDKLFHFENIALPQYQKEVKEMNEEGFDKQYKLSQEIVSGKHEGLSEKAETIKKEIGEELFWFSHLEESNQKDEEYNLFLFKAIRRLNNAFNKELEKK
jgi:hypothetical protein